jgi:predicted adenylyl cyclase CyaB
VRQITAAFSVPHFYWSSTGNGQRETGNDKKMARNVEIKAHIESINSIFPKAAALADKGPVEILQDDTFFSCPNGRLKLRAFSSEKGELIFYRRSDQSGPKESFYVISPTTSPDTLREVLSLAYGQAGRVRKSRTLFLAGRTRIHLDRVEGLGEFLELEVVLTDGESVETGEAVARELMEKLGIQPDQLIDVPYVDLLARKTS